jgi:hypothetical protein
MFYRLFIACFLCLLSLKGLGQPQDLQLFLLIGQSNMAGRGVPEAEDTINLPGIWMLNQNEQWVPAREPLHFDKPRVAGVGPGFAFARELQKKNHDQPIGLIPAAAGGSSINVWQPGGYHDQTKSHPYDDAISRTQTALQAGTIRGILWHQGESDAHPDSLIAYGDKLIALVQRLRQEFKQPELPVVVGEISKFYYQKKPAAADLNRLLHQLENEIPYFRVVKANRTTDKGDGTHFDTPSARKMGQRYAKAMLKLLSE